MEESSSSKNSNVEDSSKTEEEDSASVPSTENQPAEEGCSSAPADPEAERKASEDALSEEERQTLREESIELKNKGNNEFGLGNFYEAADLYTKALDKCPLVFSSDRATYLSNRAASHMKLFDWEAAIKDCTEAIELGPPNDKPLERRAYSYAMSEDNFDKALEDYESLAQKYPKKRMYRDKVEELKRGIHERNEKMKQDMLEKLKSLGNMCLRPFGLSTDSFELQQQPGGGYSISMKK